MTASDVATQLGIRLALIAALLTTVGITSYSATHWEPRTSKAPSDSLVTVRQ